MQLSEHFTLEEFTLSQVAMRQAIANLPNADQVENLKRLAALLEAARKALDNAPIIISSGFRSVRLNLAVGGSRNSYHMKGQAVDFIAPAFGNVVEVARRISESGLLFDQLIVEYGRWVHLGIADSGRSPRRQLLSVYKPGQYVRGIA